MPTVARFSAGATGRVYAATASVEAIDSHELGSFAGTFSVAIGFQGVGRTEQERFVKSKKYVFGYAVASMSEMTWNPAVINTLLNLTSSSTGTLNDGITSATTYTVTQATKPQSLQVLFRGQHDETGKWFEIRGLDAVCEEFPLYVPRIRLIQHNVRFLFMEDSSGNIVSFAYEN